LLDAARDLGATQAKAVNKVLLPLLLPGVLAGGLLAFAFAVVLALLLLDRRAAWPRP
jgi:spermidine/putrescine transport system permease protein